MFLITLLDEGFVQETTYATNNEELLSIVKRLHKENYSSSNDEGYVAVDKAHSPGETATRILQLNLDEEPEDVEEELKEYLNKENENLA